MIMPIKFGNSKKFDYRQKYSSYLTKSSTSKSSTLSKIKFINNRIKDTANLFGVNSEEYRKLLRIVDDVMYENQSSYNVFRGALENGKFVRKGTIIGDNATDYIQLAYNKVLYDINASGQQQTQKQVNDYTQRIGDLKLILQLTETPKETFSRRYTDFKRTRLDHEEITEVEETMSKLDKIIKDKNTSTSDRQKAKYEYKDIESYLNTLLKKSENTYTDKKFKDFVQLEYDISHNLQEYYEDIKDNGTQKQYEYMRNLMPLFRSAERNDLSNLDLSLYGLSAMDKTGNLLTIEKMILNLYKDVMNNLPKNKSIDSLPETYNGMSIRRRFRIKVKF